MTKPEIRDPTPEERFNFFVDRVCALAGDMGIDAYAMLVEVGDYRAVSRFPDCGPECENPDDCAKRIFRIVAADFTDTANEIEQGKSEVVHRKPTGDA